jgi:hypothetical protein
VYAHALGAGLSVYLKVVMIVSTDPRSLNDMLQETDAEIRSEKVSQVFCFECWNFSTKSLEIQV